MQIENKKEAKFIFIPGDGTVGMVGTVGTTWTRPTRPAPLRNVPVLIRIYQFDWSISLKIKHYKENDTQIKKWNGGEVSFIVSVGTVG